MEEHELPISSRFVIDKTNINRSILVYRIGHVWEVVSIYWCNEQIEVMQTK